MLVLSSIMTKGKKKIKIKKNIEIVFPPCSTKTLKVHEKNQRKFCIANTFTKKTIYKVFKGDCICKFEK